MASWTPAQRNPACSMGGATWVQGETDYPRIDDATITKAQFKAAMLSVTDWFHTAFGGRLPFMILRTAYRTSTGDTAGARAVRDVQMELAAERDGVFMVYTGAIRFPANGGLSDSVHWNQSAKNRAGQKAGIVAATLMAGRN